MAKAKKRPERKPAPVTVTGRAPMTTPRSEWVEEPARGPWKSARRNVFDGRLRAIVSNEAMIGWHLSVSHFDHAGRPGRYPTWDELADARDALLPADVAFVMIFPVPAEYVAVHPTTMHLYQFEAPREASKPAPELDGQTSLL